MIVVDLVCEHEHRFEGWFATSEALDQQRETGLLSCPNCGSHAITRLPSAPHVARSGAAPDSAPAAKPGAGAPVETALLAERLVAQLRALATQSEDVGERFPEEARRIHKGDAEDRAIRGKASTDDLFELWEEGISVLPLPPVKEDLH